MHRELVKSKMVNAGEYHAAAKKKVPLGTSSRYLRSEEKWHIIRVITCASLCKSKHMFCMDVK